MITLAKFIQNDNPQSTNLLITRTFGKFGVLHRESVAKMDRKPRANEWWYCEVVRETGANTERGCWVLKPIRKVGIVERDGFRDNDITYLLPNMYEYHRVGNVLLLYPKREGPNWICPNSMRQHLMRRHRTAGAYQVNTIMVVFDAAAEWPREYNKRSEPIIPED
jgi:hypothetical protein